MIIVDTSVWIDHVRRREHQILALVEEDRALLHPFALGEIVLGNLKDRSRWLLTFRRIPPAPVASIERVFGIVEKEMLYGSGIGYVDAHLLASAVSIEGGRLWTRDRRLAVVADRIGIRAGIE